MTWTEDDGESRMQLGKLLTLLVARYPHGEGWSVHVWGGSGEDELFVDDAETREAGKVLALDQASVLFAETALAFGRLAGIDEAKLSALQADADALGRSAK